MDKDRKRILIVDDQQDNLYLLRVLLTSHGYEVLEAQDGQEALDQLRQNRCNLVLLDIMMPGMDGYEVCQQIRSDERIRDLPIILLTAKKDVESKVRGLDIGANDYVTKPFDRQEILARIRSLLTIEDLKRKLVSAERLAAVGSMVVTLNHEINNPLAAIAGNAELLEMTLKDAPRDVREKLRVIQDQCMRIKDILIRIRNLKEANPKAYLQDTDMIDLDVESEAEGGEGATVIS